MTILSWQDDETGQTEFVQLDSVQTEQHEDTVTVTDHPVEQGANITDHAREEPTRLTIEGIVSTIPNPRIDTDAGFQALEIIAPVRRERGSQTIQLDPPAPPITPSVGGLVRAGIGALFANTARGQFKAETAPGTASLRAQALQQNNPRNRVRDVYDLLLKAQSRRFLVTVASRHREHFDMLIERVAQPRAVEDGSSAKFQVDLRRIRVAESQTVQAPQPTEARGKTSVNKGSQAAKKDEDPKQRRQTLIRAIDTAVGGPAGFAKLLVGG